DLMVNVMSFGFKNGVPLDADFMFDVRFLANPYYELELRSQTGLDTSVSEYVLEQPKALETVESISTLMEKWIPLHAAAGKTFLTVAIGCTGGQHRSVAITQALVDSLNERFTLVTAMHRDL
ncbi:MAG: RNase adaptor protein RapZ, partial [Oceanospirillaceae bacterium]|nr:RNase adaptor protein RapZ [Oceanospirillaceae bacterium]